MRSDRIESVGGGARGTGGVRGASGRGAVKPTLKRTLAEPKSAVKVKPRNTAPKSDLSSRGAKLTPAQKKERAGNLYFDKAERRWEGEYLTTQTGLRGPKGVTSQSVRGQGTKSLRKTAAIKKEASKKLPIKIKSK